MTVEDWDRLALSLEYPAGGPVTRQEEYVVAFDFDPECSLEMGWHLHGERPERGAFLARLRAELATADIAEGDNLPDYLPTLLRLIGRRPPAQAVALAATIAPAAERVLERLRARRHPFVTPLEDVVRALDAARQEERL